MSNPQLKHPVRPSEDDLAAFLDRTKELLQLEREAEEEQTRLLNSNCSPKLLEQRGLALGGLGVASIRLGLGGKNLIELLRPLAYHVSTALPPHTFRNGDPVRIEAHVGPAGTKSKGKKKADDDEDGAVEGIVYKVSAEQVTVAVDGSKNVDLPERLRLLKLANSVTFHRMDRTVDHLKRLVVHEDGAPTPVAHNFPLINALLATSEPTWLADIPAPLAEEANDTAGPSDIRWMTDLNDSQKDAIRFCLTADTVACIHGPPGTGKTHTLVELIYQLLLRPASANAQRPPRILIATPSNLALDNILLRLHALSSRPPFSDILPRSAILRLGHPTRVHRELVSTTLDWQAANGEEGELVKDVKREIEGHLGDLGRKRGEKGAIKGKDRGKRWEEVRELRKEHRQREGKVVSTVVNRAQVVLATCHSAGSRQLNNLLFDVCIIDEATQAVEAVCWVPILKSQKLILAGDPQQLPPMIMSKDSKPKNRSKAKGTESKDGDKVIEDDVVVTEQGPIAENDAAASDANRPPSQGVAEMDISDRPALRPPRTLERTLFDRLERLYGSGIKRVLQVQYRMNEQIAAFPSSELYEDGLVSAPSAASRTLLELPGIEAPESEDAVDALTPNVVFFDTAGCEFYERSEGGSGDGAANKGSLGEGSKSNENEAEVVSKWARKLVSLGVPAADIAVVTPYQAQVSLVSSMLHEEFPDMTIGSVDGLQGQEREAIILTLVRSNPTGEVGFLGEYRRLNVAMTRAKRQLCVVGDSATVGKGSEYLKKWMAWLEAEADVRWAGDDNI